MTTIQLILMLVFTLKSSYMHVYMYILYLSFLDCHT